MCVPNRSAGSPALTILGGVLVLSLLIAGGAPSLFAQSNTGRLVGTVVDAQGGVIPGVSVSITDNLTKRERKLLADENGAFVVPQLDSGS